jgi:acetyl esterase/lipase
MERTKMKQHHSVSTNLLFVALLSTTLFAQQKEIPLWPAGPPNSNEIIENETISEGYRIANISEATLTIFLPEKSANTKTAVIICPGGGYRIECFDKEGIKIAQWLNTLGIAGIILKYRIPNKHHQIPLMDAQRAIRTVRFRTKEWNINTVKIGIMGFSAGGHLASTAATHFDNGDKNAEDPIERISSRPDFLILVYPVVTMKEEFTHRGSRRSLLGDNPKYELVRNYSNELQVTSDTPPTFFVLSDDDKSVVAENSIKFYLALRKHNIPSEIHIFKRGGHGFGFGQEGMPVSNWRKLCELWLEEQELISR